MLARIGLGFVLLLTVSATLSAWAQAVPEASESPGDRAREERMLAPPVNGIYYSISLLSEEQTNYYTTGVTVSSGYIHNLEAGTGTAPVNDASWLIQPNMAMYRSTSRMNGIFSYTPSFALYQPSSVLNAVNQTGIADMYFRLGPHVTLRTADVVERTSSAFGAGTLPEVISGSPGSVTPGVLAPFAPQLTNTNSTVLLWQLDRSNMFAASGQLTNLEFTNPSQASGFYNSRNAGGSAAWSHCLTDRQYIGVIGQYGQIVATPLRGAAITAQSNMSTYSSLGYYTVYFQPNFSMSLVGGEQRYDLTQAQMASASGSAATGTVSLGWRGQRTSFALSGSRAVTSGNGIVGAWETSSANGSGIWRMARTWTASLDGSYSRIATVSPQFSSSLRGGNTATGSATILHNLGNRMECNISYTHLRQTYSGIPALSANPESDRVTVSLAYLFTHVLGR
jgi:hypothetical protein